MISISGRYEKREYQEKMAESVRKSYEKGYKHSLLISPTGTGKTFMGTKISADIINEALRQAGKDGTVLFLEGTDLMMEQASKEIWKITGEKPSFEWGKLKSRKGESHFVMGSVRTLANEERLREFAKENRPDFIVIDEAHHAVAPSYRMILDCFANVKSIGLTASPDRTDFVNLGEYFDSNPANYSLPDAIKDGNVCPVSVVIPKLELSDAALQKDSSGTFYQSAEEVFRPLMPEIAEVFKKEAAGRKTIAFMPTVDSAKELARVLKEAGLNAECVDGKNPDRSAIIGDFENGKIDILCNSSLLVEGYDCPLADCVAIFRVTDSKILMTQMAGRAMRKAEGKEDALLLDFTAMSERHDICTTAALISPDKEMEEAVREEMTQSGRVSLDESLRMRAGERMMRARERTVAEKIKELAKSDGNVLDPLQYAWSTGEGEIYNYKPALKAEMVPASAETKEALQKYGISVRGLQEGKAKLILETVERREKGGYANPKQIRRLERMGFQNVGKWSYASAYYMKAALKTHSLRELGIDPKTYDAAVYEKENMLQYGERAIYNAMHESKYAGTDITTYGKYEISVSDLCSILEKLQNNEICKISRSDTDKIWSCYKLERGAADKNMLRLLPLTNKTEKEQIINMVCSTGSTVPYLLLGENISTEDANNIILNTIQSLGKSRADSFAKYAGEIYSAAGEEYKEKLIGKICECSISSAPETVSAIEKLDKNISEEVWTSAYINFSTKNRDVDSAVEAFGRHVPDIKTVKALKGSVFSIWEKASLNKLLEENHYMQHDSQKLAEEVKKIVSNPTKRQFWQIYESFSKEINKLTVANALLQAYPGMSEYEKNGLTIKQNALIYETCKDLFNKCSNSDERLQGGLKALQIIADEFGGKIPLKQAAMIFNYVSYAGEFGSPLEKSQFSDRLLIQSPEAFSNLKEAKGKDSPLFTIVQEAQIREIFRAHNTAEDLINETKKIFPGLSPKQADYIARQINRTTATAKSVGVIEKALLGEKERQEFVYKEAGKAAKNGLPSLTTVSRIKSIAAIAEKEDLPIVYNAFADAGFKDKAIFNAVKEVFGKQNLEYLKNELEANKQAAAEIPDLPAEESTEKQAKEQEPVKHQISNTDKSLPPENPGEYLEAGESIAAKVKDTVELLLASSYPEDIAELKTELFKYGEDLKQKAAAVSDISLKYNMEEYKFPAEQMRKEAESILVISEAAGIIFEGMQASENGLELSDIQKKAVKAAEGFYDLMENGEAGKYEPKIPEVKEQQVQQTIAAKQAGR